jgi:hypothetical protein
MNTRERDKVMSLQLSERELYDLLGCVESDSLGKHGDDRSLRLDKLEAKLKRYIAKNKREGASND